VLEADVAAPGEAAALRRDDGADLGLHDAMPDELRPGILLGAFAGLRVAGVWGLRVADVDFMRAMITLAVQYPTEPLKTAISRTANPIPRSLANTLARARRPDARRARPRRRGGGERVAARPVGAGARRQDERRGTAGRVPVSTTSGTTSRRC
jgi:integrase